MSDKVIISSSSNENEKSSSKAKKNKLLDVSSDNNVKRQKMEEKKEKVVKVQFQIPVQYSSGDLIRNFVKTCLDRRDDKVTKEIIQKLKKLFNKLSSSQKNNEDFKLFINSCHERITKGFATDIYSPIWDLQKEIKRLLQIKKAMKNTNDTRDVEEAELPQEDMKKIEQLENAIQECVKKIKELEQEEVDWDENDSAHIQVDRHKKKLNELCHSLNKMNGDTSMRRQMLKKKIRRKDIPGEMTGVQSLDEAIVNMMNSDLKKIYKMNLETQNEAQFVKTPEYLDILQCIRECNEVKNLYFIEETLKDFAKNAFKAIGNYLKRKRIKDIKEYMQFLLGEDENENPATKDAKKTRQQNRIPAAKKTEGVFTKFIKKQDDLKDKKTEKKREGASKGDIKSRTDSRDNSIGQLALKSSRSQNSFVVKKPSNLKKTFQVFADVNNDASFTDNDNYLDDITAAEDPLDIEKLCESKLPIEKSETNEIKILSGRKHPTMKTETNEIRLFDIKASCNTITKNLADVAKVDNSPEVKAPFIKVREFAKAPAWDHQSQREKSEPVIIDLT